MLVKDAISQYPTLPFLAIRFGIATLVVAAATRRPPSREVIRVGALIGLVLAAGYVFQTVGLVYTSPGNAGLITGLFVVFTPILDRLFGTPLPARTLLATAAALIGTVLLTGTGARVGGGELLMLACAAAFALHIVLLSRWAPGLPPGPLALVQMAASTVVFTAGSLPALRLPAIAVWPALLITGIFASGLAFFIQTWTQRHLAASRAALVLATEPAWALLFAVVLAGQRLSWLQMLGAGLVLVAIAGHELAAVRSGRR